MIPSKGSNSDANSRKSTMIIKRNQAGREQNSDQIYEDLMNGDFSIIDHSSSSSSSSSSSIDTEDFAPSRPLSSDEHWKQMDSYCLTNRPVYEGRYQRRRRPNYYDEQELYDREDAFRREHHYDYSIPSTPRPTRACQCHTQLPLYPQHPPQRYRYNPMYPHYDENNDAAHYVRADRQHHYRSHVASTPMSSDQQPVKKLSAANKYFVRRRSIDKYNRDELYIPGEDKYIHLKLGLFILTIGSVSYALFC
ncbi:hypothetical protein BDF20DRAFT_863043 [Mycotypha africana]|uniref:uncharacterized protein n=1 Tax=Mycotypha africana TaxID=64632 RepID=UPI0022FFD62F|nr:uncharacterized protein BDF20DRAFT_863043 [Mycotypha africana]KAI8981753.1 hypothetical protein BDF20DRAFT_863043 [Mycotypha africana]